jgi:two-component sensor histidine kinase/ligand-binding sensor protein
MNPDLSILDLFKKEELQQLQDAFSDATGVASLITDPEGNPLTRESNYTKLCTLIRETAEGLGNCRISNATIGKGGVRGFTIQPCLSCGIWAAGTPITVGGVHIANWLIGQVRDEQINADQVLSYAERIGADKERYAEAFQELPSMSLDRLKKVAEALVVLARNLSERAFTNVKQKQLIKEWSITLNKLEQSQARNEAFLSAIPDLILQFDRKGIIIDVHEGEEGKALASPELIKGEPIAKFVPPEIAKLTNEKLSLLYEEEKMQVFDYTLELGGLTKEFECRLVQSGRDEALAIIRDVSQRNEAFRQLKGSLREKEVLIQELFHRTKNNMQMIRSLLSLQANCYEDPKIVSALQEAEMRILAMALVHQQLYHSGDLSSIDLQSYVGELATTIIDSLGRDDLSINFISSVEPFKVLIDVAIPVGLIINELISNSIHHAFKNRKEGEIEIKIIQGEGEDFLLHYRDDGENPEPGFSLDKIKTLGLQTVQILVQQLNGSINWEESGGLEYRIALTNSGYKERI